MISYSDDKTVIELISLQITGIQSDKKDRRLKRGKIPRKSIIILPKKEDATTPG
jgi:hypothetical protein